MCPWPAFHLTKRSLLSVKVTSASRECQHRGTVALRTTHRLLLSTSAEIDGLPNLARNGARSRRPGRTTDSRKLADRSPVDNGASSVLAFYRKKLVFYWSKRRAEMRHESPGMSAWQGNGLDGLLSANHLVGVRFKQAARYRVALRGDRGHAAFAAGMEAVNLRKQRSRCFWPFAERGATELADRLGQGLSRCLGPSPLHPLVGRDLPKSRRGPG
jgi:hypothetical protein